MFLQCQHVLSVCKFKRIRRIAIFTLNLIVGLSVFEAHSAEKFTNSEKIEIKKLIRQYIKQNPEIVMEALEDIQKKEKSQTAKEQSRQLKLNRHLIEKDTADPILGNPDGQITITEFFDYQCGYCKRMLNILLDISQGNKNVKIILKEYPILGSISTLAAQAALAAKKQDKYSEFHTALMLLRGRLSESAVFQIAKEVGINTKKLQLDMMQPEILEHLRRTRELGGELMIRGTPAFIINDAIFPGALSNQELLNLITESQKNS